MPLERPRFCPSCGDPLVRKFLEKEGHFREVCPSCGHIAYRNPTPVVGCLALQEGHILLARRAIEPRRGLWTLPGGFMELGETVAQGAARETWEEAGARVENLRLYTMIDIPSAGQVMFFFLADLAGGIHAPGPESLETQLFAPEEIPWGELSFATVRTTLEHYLEDLPDGVFPLHTYQVGPDARPEDL